jgi:hypothetical protein
MAGSKKIAVRGLKITTLIDPNALIGLVPDEPQPAGNPVIELALEGSTLAVTATLNGKGVRKAIKTIVAAGGPDQVVVVLQGTIKAPVTPGGPHVVEGAGITATAKTPRPTEPQGTGG